MLLTEAVTEAAETATTNSITNGSTMYVMDGFILIAALYLLYLGIKMKRTGEISKSVMNPDTMAKCRDKKGFIDFLFPRLMIFGVCALLCAVASLLLDIYQAATWTVYVSTGVFLLIFVWFIVDYRKALTKFF